MNAADRQTFAAAFYALAEAFSEPLTDLKAEAYFDALADLEVDVVLPAMRLAIKECRFFPRPIEIRERVAPAVPPLALPAAVIPGTRVCRGCGLAEEFRDDRCNLSPDTEDIPEAERGLCIPCWVKVIGAAVKAMPALRAAALDEGARRIGGLLSELRQLRREIAESKP